ncbi:MAG: RNA polymerase sigma factor [Polyangia bacterium]
MNHLRVVWSAPAEGARPSCLDAFQQELDYIFRTLRRLCGSAADVEDLAQEVFLAMRSGWARYDAARPLKPYIYGIVLHIAAAHHRTRRREVIMTGVDRPDPSPGADDAFHSHHVRDIVLAALDTLPLRHRSVLVMHDIDGVAVADVARELSMPLFTVYSRLRKARAQFKAAAGRLLRQVNRRWIAAPPDRQPLPRFTEES